jgi:DNA-binding NarL/FixJ family response regulator
MWNVLKNISSIDIIRQVDTYEELHHTVGEFPDVVVIGCLADLPDPVTAALRFIDSKPVVPSKILVLADQPEAAGTRLLGDPRVGLVSVRVGPDEFLSALRLLAAGYIVSTAAGRPHRADQESVSSQRIRSERITRRESDVLRLLVRGQTNAEMARRLSLTESTVKFHVQSLLRKLRLPNRASAVAYAYESGLVHVGEGTVVIAQRHSAMAAGGDRRCS